MSSSSVSFTKTTSAKLDTKPISEGSIVVLEDSDRLYYEINGERRSAYKHPTFKEGNYHSVKVDAEGHVTAGSNPTTLSGYGITDAALSRNIASSTSVDTITKPGIYRGSSAPGIPDGVTDFGLAVSYIGTDAADVIQILYSDTSQYTRRLLEGTWSDWSQGSLVVSTSHLVTSDIKIISDVGSLPSANDISTSEVTHWDAGSLPDLRYSTSTINNVTAAGEPTSVSLSQGVLSVSTGSAPSLADKSVSIITNWEPGALSDLDYSEKTCSKLTSLGSLPSVDTATVATGSIASTGSGAEVVTSVTN